MPLNMFHFPFVAIIVNYRSIRFIFGSPGRFLNCSKTIRKTMFPTLRIVIALVSWLPGYHEMMRELKKWRGRRGDIGINRKHDKLEQHGQSKIQLNKAN